MLIKDLTETMNKKSKEIVQIYDDQDGSFKAEGAICTGNLSAFKQNVMDEREEQAPNVWDNFYSKLDEIDVSIGHSLL